MAASGISTAVQEVRDLDLIKSSGMPNSTRTFGEMPRIYLIWWLKVGMFLWCGSVKLKT